MHFRIWLSASHWYKICFKLAGDEPKKKKLKAKKKKSTKKRDEGSKKCAEEEVSATDGEKETEGMDLNESGGSDLNDEED